MKANNFQNEKENRRTMILDDIIKNVLNGENDKEILNIIESIYESKQKKLEDLIKKFAKKYVQNEEEEILTMLAIAFFYQKDKNYIMIAGILADIKRGQYQFDYITILRFFFDCIDNYNIKLAEHFLKALRIKALIDSKNMCTLDELVSREIGYTLTELEQEFEQAKKRKEEKKNEWEPILQSILIKFKTSSEKESMIYLDEPLDPAERETLRFTINSSFRGQLQRYNVGTDYKRRVVLRYLNPAKVDKTLSRDYTSLYHQQNFLECISAIKNIMLDPNEECVSPLMYAYLASAYYMEQDIMLAKFYMEIAIAFNQKNLKDRGKMCRLTNKMMKSLQKKLDEQYQLLKAMEEPKQE